MAMQFSETVRFSKRGALAALVLVLSAGTALANDPPEITKFTAKHLDGPNNYWYFSGVVDDENVEGCTVVVGGDLFEDVTVNVNPNGTFSYAHAVTPGASGWVRAQATDPAGQKSGVKWVYVDD